jgi:hypothetical protein
MNQCFINQGFSMSFYHSVSPKIEIILIITKKTSTWTRVGKKQLFLSR